LPVKNVLFQLFNSRYPSTLVSMGRNRTFMAIRATLLPCLLGFLFPCLQSCSAPSKQTNITKSPLYPEEIASALLTDEALAKDLEIQDQSFIRGTDKIVLAQGYLLNKTNQTLTVEVRTLFKSTQGETLESSPWKRLVLPPKIRVAQAAPSINPMVTRYLLEIRRAP
jgi:hypothetical protein